MPRWVAEACAKKRADHAQFKYLACLEISFFKVFNKKFQLGNDTVKMLHFGIIFFDMSSNQFITIASGLNRAFKKRDMSSVTHLRKDISFFVYVSLAITLSHHTFHTR